MTQELSGVDLSGLPLDGVVVVNDTCCVAQLPADGSRKVKWVPLANQDEAEQVIVSTKLRMMGAMLLHKDRNAAYARALAKTVKPGDVVLDAGAGTGLLSMMAARAGARKVLACEMNDSIARVAKRVVEANRLSDVVQVIPYRTDSVIVGESVTDDSVFAMDEKVDVVVCELMDSVLTTEGIIGTLSDVKERLLKPNGRIIPQKGRVLGRLVALKNVLTQVQDCAKDDPDLLASCPLLIQARSNTMRNNMESISDDIVLHQMEFGTLRDSGKLVSILDFNLVRPIQNGEQIGLLMYWDVELCEGIAISTKPEDNEWQDHWHHALYLLGGNESISKATEKVAAIQTMINLSDGTISVSWAKSEQSEGESKRARFEKSCASNDLQRLRRLWHETHWTYKLKAELEAILNEASTSLSLLDFSASGLANRCQPLIRHPDNASVRYLPYAPIATISTPTIACCVDSDIQGILDVDLALLFSFQCARLPTEPRFTVPFSATIRCAVLNLKDLENPRDALTNVAGFDHTAMFANFKNENAVWTFPLVLANYDWMLACEEAADVAVLEFGSGRLEFKSHVNLLVKEKAHLLVTWVAWRLKSTNQWVEPTSPFGTLDPLIPVQAQFLRGCDQGCHLTLGCDLDQQTNRILVTHSLSS